MSCASYSDSTDRITSSRCGQKGVVVQLGFNIAVEKIDVWLPQVELCHDIDSMYTFYASHKVYGHSIKGAIKGAGRKAFAKGDKRLFKNVNMEMMYSKNNQIDSFNDIFNDKDAGKYFINTDGGEQYLAKGHLAPDADFVYYSEQMLTYYFTNAAPQWQLFNNGNWLNKIEKFVRCLASELKMTLDVYTGTHGVLQLSYKGSGMKDIYLKSPNNKNIQIPVPQVFWKMVQDPTTKACTVVVAHNNIFLKTPPTHICASVTPSGWPAYDGSIGRGYFYYCDYTSFKKVVSSPDAQCNGMINALYYNGSAIVMGDQ